MTARQRAALVEAGSSDISIVRQAALLSIARSTVYYQPQVCEQDVEIMNRIDEVYTNYPFYGSRKMKIALREHDIYISRKKVQRLMRAMGIQAIYPKIKKKTSISHPEHYKFPYLLRNLQIRKPDHVWGTDITYIRLTQGYAYLTALLDWFSRYVIAWVLSYSLESTFCIEALKKALQQGHIPDIHNSDQGVQYTSKDYVEVLQDHEITISMDGRGRCMDNIFTERLWRAVKYEHVYLNSYRTLAEAEQGLTEYFIFYNTKRPHQALDYQTPEQVYFGKQ